MDQLSKITPISSVFHQSHSFKVLMSTSRNLMNSSEFVFEVEICHSANPFEVIDPMIFTNCEYPTLLVLGDTPVGSQEQLILVSLLIFTSSTLTNTLTLLSLHTRRMINKCLFRRNRYPPYRPVAIFSLPPLESFLMFRGKYSKCKN